MALPKQVEAQLRELEALEKQLTDAQNPAPECPDQAAEHLGAADFADGFRRYSTNRPVAFNLSSS